MRNAIMGFIFCFCVSMLLNMSGNGMAEAMPETGPDGKHFIFYVDNSGSMSLGYHERGSSKMDVAVKLLHALNDEMPDIKANVGVYTYGPHREYRRVIPYDRDSLKEAFNQIPTDFAFAGRITPMGSGIQNLDTTIAALPGTVNFVVVTGGDYNAGDPPDEVIQNVYERYEDRVCFHFISFARKASEKDFVQNLSGLNECSVLADAVDLLDESARANFIEKVFGP